MAYPLQTEKAGFIYARNPSLAPLDDPFYVFQLSMMALASAGVGLVALNSYVTYLRTRLDDSQSKRIKLVKALWKMDLKEYFSKNKNYGHLDLSYYRKEDIYFEGRWGWRKLLISGCMVAAVIVSIAVKLLPTQHAILCGVVVYSLWVVFLLIYWYIILAQAPSTKVLKLQEAVDLADPKIIGWKQKIRDRESNSDSRLPVTIVTGYLGSGKTTLIKNILHNTVGMKVLVIENEIGAEGIDHELLMKHTAKEEIILMNNGCICCTVRKDLLTTFQRLFANDAFARLDWVVIETTGLADPAPLIQSLYMDSNCSSRLRLDGVLAVVDCKHFPIHMQKRSTTQAPQENGEGPQEGSRKSNSYQEQGAHGGLPEAVIQVSFADRILLNKIDLVSQDEVNKVKLAIQSLNSAADIYTCEHSVVDITKLLNIRAFDPNRNGMMLSTNNNDIFIPRDSNGKILRKNSRFTASAAARKLMAKDAISTTSLTTCESMDVHKFNEWISALLQKDGDKIFRMKGILSMHGFDHQFVVQGVHMLFDGELGQTWADGERKSRLVFIGRGLDAESLEREFLNCVHVNAATVE